MAVHMAAVDDAFGGDLFCVVFFPTGIFGGIWEWIFSPMKQSLLYF